MINQHYERENPKFWDKKKEKDITREQLDDARQIIFLLEGKISTLESLIQSISENSNDKWTKERLKEIVYFIKTNKL